MKTHTDLIEIVDKLNDACYGMTEETGLCLRPFSFGTCGDNSWIEFNGAPIWSNVDGEQDMRHEIGGFLEAISKLNPAALIALLPPSIPDDL